MARNVHIICAASENDPYPVSGASVTLGSGESFPPSIQSSGDNGTRVPNILPGNLVVHVEVSQLMGALNWASGLIPLCHLHLRPLQRHFHSLGSDKPVCTIAAFRPCSPCYPTQAVAGPIVSHIRNPYPAFPGGVHHFHGRLDSGLGRPHGGFSNCGCMDPFRTRAPHQYVLELREVILALHHWVTILQGHHVLIATDNTTVIAYINKQGGTHSHLLLRLVVDLFLWLQTRDITLRARHILSCLNVIADRLSRPNQPIMTEWSLHPEVMNRIFRLWGTPVVDMFATVHNTHLPQFMSPVPEPRALAIDALSQDWQGRSMYIFPPFPLLNKVIQKLGAAQTGEVILVAPWWPSQLWFPHLL